jgi:copper chaperone CopZ
MLCLLLSGITVYSQNSKTIVKDTTATFKVFGVCEQCKHRIEGALKTKGIKAADWNVDTKMLTVSYDPSKISNDKIHTKLAAVGHDTYLKKANDAVYNSLLKCCYYREMESMEDTKPAIGTSLATAKPDTTGAQVQSIKEHIIKGVVLEEDNKGAFKPLPGASVVWVGANSGTITDENGVFQYQT